jgi:hypothetical protein
MRTKAHTSGGRQSSFNRRDTLCRVGESGTVQIAFPFLKPRDRCTDGRPESYLIPANKEDAFKIGRPQEGIISTANSTTSGSRLPAR